MRFPFRSLAGLALAAILIAPAAGASNNAYSRILLNLAAPTAGNGCAALYAAPPCAGAITAGTLFPQRYFAYVLVGDSDPFAGLAGLQFGIEYDNAPHSGVDILGWTLCATMEFSMTGWPAAGTGTIITWDRANNCQRVSGGSAVAGYFYLTAYSPDELRIVPRQVDGCAKVADCDAFESILVGCGVNPPASPLGTVAFSAGGGTPGYNPCGSGGPPPPSCGITGPDVLPQNSGPYDYSVTVSDPAATIAWSVGGNGALIGSITGPSVQVMAGGKGNLTLTVTATNGSGSSQCDKAVLVDEVRCNIFGPAGVHPGTSSTYTVSSTLPPPVTWVWSVSGNATIESTSGASAVIAAGAVGSYQVGVDFSNDRGAGGSCALNVSVTSAVDCAIQGPSVISASGTGIYSIASAPAGTLYQWSVTGSGGIVGASTEPTVTILGLGAGSFTLTVTATTSTETRTCQRTVSVVLPGPRPGPNMQAKILLHVKNKTTKNACTTWGVADCAQISTSGSLYPGLYFAYVLVADGFTDGTTQSGIGGAQFGITYDGATGAGVDIYSWTCCASHEISQIGWPASGTGNLITWDMPMACQHAEPGGPGTGVVATLGFLYMAAYSPDMLRITAHPVDGLAKVADCQAGESIIDSATNPRSPSPLGMAAFSADGRTPGYSPCGGPLVPVEWTTWSRIKAMYGGR